MTGQPQARAGEEATLPDPAFAHFELGRFERVPAGGGQALLRVSGRWLAPAPTRLAAPELLVRAHGEVHGFSSLPGPDDAAPLAGPDPPGWRAAYMVPGELLTGCAPGYALAGARDWPLALPDPAERLLAAVPPPSNGAEPGPEDMLRDQVRRRLDAERVAESRREALRKLGARVRRERAGRAAAQQAAAAAEQSAAQLQEALAGREREMAGLLGRVEMAERETAAVHAAQQETEAELAALREELRATRVELRRVEEAAGREPELEVEPVTEVDFAPPPAPVVAGNLALVPEPAPAPPPAEPRPSRVRRRRRKPPQLPDDPAERERRRAERAAKRAGQARRSTRRQKRGPRRLRRPRLRRPRLAGIARSAFPRSGREAVANGVGLLIGIAVAAGLLILLL